MIKIGHIGIAHDHSSAFMACVRKYPDIFKVVGIAEEDPENIRRFGKTPCYDGIPFMRVEELLNSPGLDAVMVETEELKLIETAQKCVDKGLHVHIDKPAGGNTEDFERLLKAAKSKKLTVQMGYMYRYNPAVQYCLDAVRSGRLGEVYQVDAVMGSWYPPEKRVWTNRFPAGNMFFLGCHMVDLVLLMQGVPDRIVPFNKSSGIDGVDAIDHAFAALEYKNGISTVRSTLTECNGYDRRQLVVCGDKGTLEIKPLELAGGIPTSVVSVTADRGWGGAYRQERLPEAAGRYDAMMLDFAAMVTGSRENPFTYEYELLVQKAVLAACGLPVEIKYTEI